MVGGTVSDGIISGSSLIDSISSQETVSAIDAVIANGYSVNWSNIGVASGDWNAQSNGNTIIDGGNDMYDKGNIINTNLGDELYYNYDVLQQDSVHFGAGSRHKIFHGTSFLTLCEKAKMGKVKIRKVVR